MTLPDGRAIALSVDTHRAPWTEAERRLLRRCLNEGKSDVAIGSMLDRAAEAVQMKRLRLGLRRKRR